MTATTSTGTEAAPVETVTCTIDEVEVTVPKGTLIIRAAEQVGIQIPRFCDHPLLAPAGACRQCLVEVAMPDREGNVRPMPKPQASCTMEVTPGMVVKTQRTSPVAEKAQNGVMELLLINHPLDCPVCDKGGECPLQNQAMTNGRSTSRFEDVKRTFPKPIAISTEILLDRERCVLCQRCTRFSEEIAGDAFIALQQRGAMQQIGRFDEAVLGYAPPPGEHRSPTPVDRPAGVALPDTSGLPFSSYFSGNTVQICPVGALTGAAYRFRARPFDLVSTPSIAEHDSCGSAIRIDHRRGVVLRRLSGDDPAVNEEWITDKDRFAFTWQAAPDRITTPLVRDRTLDRYGKVVARGELRPASWVEALELAAEGLADARAARGIGVLAGGRLTVEDAYAWSRFARTVLGTDDVDQRARVHSDEEARFLAHAVAGSGVGVTFGDLEKAPVVLLAGLEAEEEAGVTFLRLRKGVLRHGVKVYSVAPFATRGLARLEGTLLPAAPGTEAEWLGSLATRATGGLLPADVDAETLASVADGLAQPGAVILVGERLAGSPGAYTQALRLAEATGARLAWIPRRAGERGGVEAGLLPGLLPGGRPLTDAAARAEVAAAWGVDADALPSEPGLDTGGILDALSVGQLSGAIVGGLELADLPDPAHARRALEAASWVVSLEVRRSEVTELADVVLPVAPPAERAGSYWNWEGRVRSFGRALESSALPDHRVLHHLAEQLGVDLGCDDPLEAHRAIAALPAWRGERPAAPAAEQVEPPPVAPGTAVLAAWHLLLDDGALQDGEQFLAGTAKRPVARMSAVTAAAADVFDGDLVTVSTDRGSITLPVAITEMVDHVVWLPLASRGCRVHAQLGASPGDVVHVAPAPQDLSEGRWDRAHQGSDTAEQDGGAA
ncbi:NADH-quinone oxidoreductase subunit G [Isoptericola variabilis]|uniref:NADH-quinone oxidoreductase, chain G n=1 Tax=Isoptericola variabilis (strain 225) TaxID=743718 RepID=F6FVA3_ISOV2|nr:NADH-quinone oxidoreductase subunit G [Isoptericola variabilis]AEG43376.1 NADH-quinone oxidoreductase, chain G [Isoptericola variabilis 225]TWH34571.1 NADH-quinone oxidoreductase subunit G [Isoptericola variabilis J7]